REAFLTRDLSQLHVDVAKVHLRQKVVDVRAGVGLGGHVERREHEDGALWTYLLEVLRQLLAVHARHDVVDDGEIGHDLARDPERGSTVRRPPDHLPARRAAQHRLQQEQDVGLVVDEQQPKPPRLQRAHATFSARFAECWRRDGRTRDGNRFYRKRMGVMTESCGADEPPSLTTTTHVEWTESHIPEPIAPAWTVNAALPAPPAPAATNSAARARSQSPAPVGGFREHSTMFSNVPRPKPCHATVTFSPSVSPS